MPAKRTPAATPAPTPEPAAHSPAESVPVQAEAAQVASGSEALLFGKRAAAEGISAQDGWTLYVQEHAGVRQVSPQQQDFIRGYLQGRTQPYLDYLREYMLRQNDHELQRIHDDLRRLARGYGYRE